MAKAKLEVTTQVETVTTVELSPKAKKMLLERIAEFAKQGDIIEAAETRQAAIKKEIDWVFGKDGQGAALIDGAAIDGHRMKWVFGTSTKLDEKKLCAEFGITPAQLASCKTTKEKKPYMKVTPKGKKDKQGDDE
jgi:hypothetical protein